MAQKTISIERFAYVTRGAYAGHRVRIDYDQGTNVWVTVEAHTLNLPDGWFVRLAGPHSLYGIPEAVHHNPFEGAPRGISREGPPYDTGHVNWPEDWFIQRDSRGEK